MLARVLFREYPGRSVYGATLMITATVPLQRDLLHLHPGAGQLYYVSADNAPIFLIAFAVGNLPRARSRSGAC